MLSGEFDVPAMLEAYTDHLMERMSEFMIGFFHSAAANAAKKIGKTDEGGQLNLVRGMLDNLGDEPWYIQALAPRLLGLLETAGVMWPAVLGAGIIGGIAMGMSAWYQGKPGASGSDALAETGQGFGNYLTSLGIVETVALFVMIFIQMALK